MANEYVIASLAAQVLSSGQAAVRVGSLGLAMLAPGKTATPLQASCFAIEVLQSTANPATRRRQTIVVC